jgi:squalene synthase HpnC
MPAVSVNHYENFPVASWLCPPALRPPIVAIYHFARTADDIADEGNASTEARLVLLRNYREDLSRALEAGADAPPSAHWPGVFGPLGEQAARHALPRQPLHDLLDAFEQDTLNPLYPNRAALLDYCRRSANPVGRLLLHLYGIQDESALRQSDAICTALQLINFWQDLSVDGPRGRCYVPEADRLAHGVPAEDLVATHSTPAGQALVASLCAWARSLMWEGAPLALRIPGRAGWELRAVVAGGLRILEKIARMDHCSIGRRPALTAADMPSLLWVAARLRASVRRNHRALAA